MDAPYWGSQLENKTNPIQIADWIILLQTITWTSSNHLVGFLWGRGRCVVSISGTNNWRRFGIRNIIFCLRWIFDGDIGGRVNAVAIDDYLLPGIGYCYRHHCHWCLRCWLAGFSTIGLAQPSLLSQYHLIHLNKQSINIESETRDNQRQCITSNDITKISRFGTQLSSWAVQT